MAEQNVITSMLDDLSSEQPIHTALCIGQNIDQNSAIQWHYFSVNAFLSLPFTQRYDLGFVVLIPLKCKRFQRQKKRKYWSVCVI